MNTHFKIRDMADQTALAELSQMPTYVRVGQQKHASDQAEENMLGQSFTVSAVGFGANKRHPIAMTTGTSAFPPFHSSRARGGTEDVMIRTSRSGQGTRPEAAVPPAAIANVPMRRLAVPRRHADAYPIDDYEAGMNARMAMIEAEAAKTLSIPRSQIPKPMMRMSSLPEGADDGDDSPWRVEYDTKKAPRLRGHVVTRFDGVEARAMDETNVHEFGEHRKPRAPQHRSVALEAKRIANRVAGQAAVGFDDVHGRATAPIPMHAQLSAADDRLKNPHAHFADVEYFGESDPAHARALFGLQKPRAVARLANERDDAFDTHDPAPERRPQRERAHPRGAPMRLVEPDLDLAGAPRTPASKSTAAMQSRAKPVPPLPYDGVDADFGKAAQPVPASKERVTLRPRAPLASSLHFEIDIPDDVTQTGMQPKQRSQLRSRAVAAGAMEVGLDDDAGLEPRARAGATARNRPRESQPVDTTMDIADEANGTLPSRRAFHPAVSRQRVVPATEGDHAFDAVVTVDPKQAQYRHILQTRARPVAMPVALDMDVRAPQPIGGPGSKPAATPRFRPIPSADQVIDVKNETTAPEPRERVPSLQRPVAIAPSTQQMFNDADVRAAAPAPRVRLAPRSDAGDGGARERGMGNP